jgi:molybdopterin-guanine dinucleotide biosynthesis protein A
MDAIVLAGGRGARLGGVDKADLVVGGQTLLERALAATAGANRTVVVGPRRPTSRPVTWAREHPPGGGPVAALAAGLEHVDGDHLAGAERAAGPKGSVSAIPA